MITGLTGLPRCGKSLMCVHDILRPMVGTFVKHADGREYPRIIYSNIDGLLLDHEKIDAEGINTWHEWAPPGAVLAIDEIQDYWPPRPNGSKVPIYIEKLATHGHMGIDIIYMTQHPMMVDQNLRVLTGRHLHIRRVGNLPAAVVYEWDHCSRQLLYSNAISKSPWRYPRSGYALYKSAMLHTKMKRKLPTVLWAFPFVIAAGVYIGPRVWATATGAKTKVAPSASAAAVAVPAPAAKPALPASGAPVVPEAAELPELTPTKSTPVVFGCARLRNVCRCYDQATAKPFAVAAGVCEAAVEPAVPLQAQPVDVFQGTLIETKNGDEDVLAFMTKAKRRAAER